MPGKQEETKAIPFKDWNAVSQEEHNIQLVIDQLKKSGAEQPLEEEKVKNTTEGKIISEKPSEAKTEEIKNAIVQDEEKNNKVEENNEEENNEVEENENEEEEEEDNEQENKEEDSKKEEKA